MSQDTEKLLNPPPPPPPYAPAPSAAPPPPYYGTQPQPQQQQAQQTTIYVQQARPVVATRVVAPDYTGLAIMAIICCFPIGLLAYYLAGKAKESAANGDAQGAYGTAISVRLLSRLAISLGSLVITAIILAIVLPITLSD